VADAICGHNGSPISKGDPISRPFEQAITKAVSIGGNYGATDAADNTRKVGPCEKETRNSLSYFGIPIRQHLLQR
jgi:hypothetical protein